MSSRSRFLPMWLTAMPRALSLLAAFASPVFACAAIAGWLTGVWPANPLTLGVSAFLVVGGPALGIVHVVMTREREQEEPPALAPAPPPPAPTVALTPRAAAARRFASWRDTPNEAITRRERERRAAQHLRH
jgi:hypothetical protein